MSAPSIRAATPDDVDALWDLHKAVIADGRGIVRDHVSPRERIEQRVAEVLAMPDRAAILVADVGRAVGEVDIQRMGPPFLRHAVHLGVEVHPDHQRRGLGRALMDGALAWCRANAVHRVELYVRADNERAIPLYRSMGFVEEGRRRHLVRLPDGTHVDDLVFGLLLD